LDPTTRVRALESLITPAATKIVFLIIDGLGGLPIEEGGDTELERARTPNLDQLASGGSVGLIEPLGAGLTPGSGPAHLALFGYDPFQYVVGRGVLGALGIEFPLEHGDVAARINFANVDSEGKITDRRAGRLPSDENEKLCRRLSEEVRCPEGYECFFRTVKEHRALLVLRGQGLSGEIEDTDPQATGVVPLPVKARRPEAESTARIFADIIEQAERLLRPEPRGNAILLRGFDGYQALPSLKGRFGLDALAIANYPMYRGIARLVGMEVHPVTSGLEEQFVALRRRFNEFDFFYLHVKEADARGEDRDFGGKVKVLEEVDAMIPHLRSLSPDVLVVTGDHSTPAFLGAHSWHPVPVLLYARSARRDNARHFGETECLAGALGRRPSVELMPLALAHALRLKKFGA
jgi:2,3-bisphosphoglycerate-independent phosphoglycerate mutase